MFGITITIATDNEEDARAFAESLTEYEGVAVSDVFRVTESE